VGFAKVFCNQIFQDDHVGRTEPERTQAFMAESEIAEGQGVQGCAAPHQG
jgi:hypothetical protein